MKIIVGSESIRKIEIVKKVAEEITKKSVNVVGIKAESKMPETPWDRETYDGARNRALFCRDSGEKADLYLGVESGLVERYGVIYEEAWTVIVSSDEREYAGYSSGLKVPDYILNKMKEYNVSHHQIFSKINGHKIKDINSDTWGQYTGNVLLRETSFAESLRNALLQVFSPDNSFYKK